MCPHRRLYCAGQCQDIRPGGTAMVDQHQCLTVVYPGRAQAAAFPAGAVNQPAGGQLDLAISLRVVRQVGVIGQQAGGVPGIHHRVFEKSCRRCPG